MLMMNRRRRRRKRRTFVDHHWDETNDCHRPLISVPHESKVDSYILVIIGDVSSTSLRWIGWIVFVYSVLVVVMIVV
jgi:hypothetical protein